MNMPARSIRGDIVQLPPPGLNAAAVNAWNGIPGSSETVLFANNDSTNTWYLGFRNTITVGGQNTIPLFPNSTVALSANRTVYAIAIKGTTPLLIVPGGVYYYTKTTTTVQGGSTILGEDPSTPPVVKVQTVNAPSGTTVSFTPPGNNLLVCIVNVNGCTSLNNITVSDSGGHTWTRKAGVQFAAGAPAANLASAIYETFIGTSAAITVTVSDSDNNAALIFTVRVMSNANSNQTTAASNTANGSGSSAGTIVNGANLTTTQQNSWFYACAMMVNQNVIDMSTDPSGLTTTIDAFDSTTVVSNMIIGRNTTPTGPPGTIFADWQCVNPASFSETYCILEILHA